MGMSGSSVLLRVELPLAVPLIAAGLPHRRGAGRGHRDAGRPGRRRRARPIINAGFGQQDRGQILAGGILVAGLALLTELVLALVQRRSRRAGTAAGRAGRRAAGPTPSPGPTSQAAQTGARTATRTVPSPFRDPPPVAVVTPSCWGGWRTRVLPRARQTRAPARAGAGHRRRAPCGIALWAPSARPGCCSSPSASRPAARAAPPAPRRPRPSPAARPAVRPARPSPATSSSS